MVPGDSVRFSRESVGVDDSASHRARSSYCPKCLELELNDRRHRTRAAGVKYRPGHFLEPPRAKIGQVATALCCRGIARIALASVRYVLYGSKREGWLGADKRRRDHAWIDHHQPVSPTHRSGQTKSAICGNGKRHQALYLESVASFRIDRIGAERFENADRRERCAHRV